MKSVLKLQYDDLVTYVQQTLKSVLKLQYDGLNHVRSTNIEISAEITVWWLSHLRSTNIEISAEATIWWLSHLQWSYCMIPVRIFKVQNSHLWLASESMMRASAILMGENGCFVVKLVKDLNYNTSYWIRLEKGVLFIHVVTPILIGGYWKIMPSFCCCIYFDWMKTKMMMYYLYSDWLLLLMVEIEIWKNG